MVKNILENRPARTSTRDVRYARRVIKAGRRKRDFTMPN